jgi:type I restriction enzyme S subunit
MKFGLEQHIIDNLISVFEQNSKVDKAYIFGSRAKGNYRTDSDIDIAIKGQEITTDDIISMSVAFESKGITFKIDLINYHTIKEPDLKDHIDRISIELYSRWKIYKFGDLCTDINYGFTASANEKPVGPKFLRITDIVPQRVDWDSVPYCEINDLDRKKYRLKKGDIVIARTGATTGYNYMFDSEVEAVFASYLIRYRIKSNLAVPKFINYSLKSNSWKGFVEGIIGGSAQPGANAKMFAEYDIILPPLHEQYAISDILSCIDSKIDLLHRQNNTLEQLAETLFRKCFIEGAVFTETLKDYVETANTGLDAIKRAPIVEYETGIKCLRIQDVSQHKPIKKWGHSKVEENNFKKFQLKRDDIIMARTCSPGINYFVREDLPAVFNNGLVRIRAKKERVNPILLYYLFKTRDFIGHIDAISGGTSVQLNMQVGQLLSYEFSFPSIEKQNEIIESFIAFDNKTFENNNQIESLIELRDTLLPKLVNGEVRISELKAVAN